MTSFLRMAPHGLVFFGLICGSAALAVETIEARDAGGCSRYIGPGIGEMLPATVAALDALPGCGAHSVCDHAASGNNYYVDTAVQGTCKAGASCTLTINLVATGEYHINREYPYKYTANDTDGLEFLGSDSSGKTVFSKSAGNWAELDEKTGKMTVTFKPASKGQKTISGTFKLSICSAANCEMDKTQISTTVSVK